MKEKIIKEKEQILNKLQGAGGENIEEKDENDNISLLVNKSELHLEAEGERSEINSQCPKLLRLKSVQVNTHTTLLDDNYFSSGSMQL